MSDLTIEEKRIIEKADAIKAKQNSRKRAREDTEEKAKKRRVVIEKTEQRLSKLTQQVNDTQEKLKKLREQDATCKASSLSNDETKKLLNFFKQYRETWHHQVTDCMIQCGENRFEDDMVNFTRCILKCQSTNLPFLAELSQIRVESVRLYTELVDKYEQYDENFDYKKFPAVPPADIVSLMKRAGVTLVMEDEMYRYRDGDKDFDTCNFRTYGAPQHSVASHQ